MRSLDGCASRRLEWRIPSPRRSYADTATIAVTTLPVAGVPPMDDRYPFMGLLALIYKEKNLTDTAKGFLDFVKCP